MPKINRGARSCQDQDKAIGERINMYRRAKKLSQADLGTVLGITFQQVQKYEKGVNRVSASRLVQISELLEVSIADLLGGSSRFVLSTSGHIQSLVNPPAPDSRSSYRLTDEPPADVDAWVRQADVRRGSWWPDYSAWLAERSGPLRAAPATLGNRQHRATAKAPGTYVHAG